MKFKKIFETTTWLLMWWISLCQFSGVFFMFYLMCFRQSTPLTFKITLKTSEPFKGKCPFHLFFRTKHIRHMLPPVLYIHIGSKQIFFWNQGFKAALPKTLKTWRCTGSRCCHHFPKCWNSIWKDEKTNPTLPLKKKMVISVVTNLLKRWWQLGI